MAALTAKHAQLLESNRALLVSFEGLSVTVKLSVVAITLALGVGGGIKALQGTASDTVQVCIRNKQILKCADRGKPYVMTEYHADQWKKDGVPDEVAFLKPTPASNPYKVLWMLLSACSFGAAGVGLRSLQNSERQLAGYEAITEKRDLAKGEITARCELLDDYRGVAIAEVHLQADLEAAANDRAVVLKQCEILGEADIKIAQLDVEDAIFDAETAGLSDDKKQEYMEFLRNQKTPFLLTGTQTLAGINNPGDKVGDRVDVAINSEQDKAKIPNLTNYPAVLIYGPQGSGKTFLAEEEIKRRKEAGHRITALDPHAGFYSWRDCDIVGAGMDYAAIDAELAQFANEVRRRYELIRKEPNPQFRDWTFVCDEYTNWASRCKASGDFFQAALSDIRKAKMYVIFVSHARTLTGLGDAKGMAATRDAALLEVELLGQIDPKTGKAVPRFEALVKLPGQSQSDHVLVKLARYSTPCASESAAIDSDTNSVPNAPISFPSLCLGTPRNVPGQDSEKAGTPYGTRAERINGVLAEILVGTSSIAVFAAESPLEQEEKMELAYLVIGQDLGIEKSIWLLWGIRRGGRNHHLYTEAKIMLQQLIDGHGY